MLYERVMNVACIKHSESSATVEKHYNNERLIQSHLRESSANQKTLFAFNPVFVTSKVLCQVFATFLSYLLKKLLSGIVHLLPRLSFGFWSVLISVNSSKTNKEKKTKTFLWKWSGTQTGMKTLKELHKARSQEVWILRNKVKRDVGVTRLSHSALMHL